jgi:lipoate-protein ligase B
MTVPGRLIIDEAVPYTTALEQQTRWSEERRRNQRADSLWLLEHEPVFTCGRTTPLSACFPSAWNRQENTRMIVGIPVITVPRGGSITYHGPGQLVGYPILRLKDYCPGPKAYVRMLEEVILCALKDWDIVGCRLDGLPGVWVGTGPWQKIASIGVRISHGITTHGFALNVAMDLSPFSSIHPCGIAGCRVTSMTQCLARPINVADVRSVVASKFADRFQMDWNSVDGASPDAVLFNRCAAR